MKLAERLSALALGMLLLARFGAGAAVNRSEWRQVQPLEVAAPGLVKVSLPAETLGALRPEAADLRLLDPAGGEVGWFLERPLRFAPETPVRRPKSFQATLRPRATVLLLETGTAQPIAGLALEAGSGPFLKAARVEGSADGGSWLPVAEGLPFYQRYQGETRLQATFPARSWAWLRVTLDDARSEPVPFTGARLQVVTPDAPAGSEPATVRITAREELPGESRLTLDLGAANLDLAALRVTSDEGVFTRAASLRVRALEQGAWTERLLARGLLHRDLSPEGTALRVAVRFEVGESVPAREAVLVIRNGDSPPLPVTAVAAELPAVQLVFWARQAGRFELLAGNPGCAAPHYDLAAFAEQFRTAAPHAATPGPLTANPGFQAPAVVPDPFASGAALEVAAWRYREAVPVARDGAQLLELDPAVLADARPDLGDLRLVSGGRQRPYVREDGVGWRTLPVGLTPADDPKQPGVSRWQVRLPHAGLPIVALRVESATALFERGVSLSETVADPQGGTVRRSLGEARWRRTPDDSPRTFGVTLTSRPLTDTLLLEVRNGDNAPIRLDRAVLSYPASRLRFLAPVSPATWLYYGNPQASAPDYDLQLVAARLLVAETASVTAGAPETLKAGADPGWSLAGRGVWFFWAALAVAVVVLLLVLRRLLPPPAA